MTLVADYKPYIKEIEPDMYQFEYDGQVNYAFDQEGKAIPSFLVERAIDEIAKHIPIDWLQGVKIFCLPYHCIAKDRFGRYAGYYHGQAFPNHIVMSQQLETNDYTVRVLIHELAGHVFTYRLIDPNPFDLKDTKDYERFKELFGITSDDKDIWELRPSEIFAEMMVQLCNYESELLAGWDYDREKFKAYVLEQIKEE